MNVTLVFPCIRGFGGFNSLGKNEGCIYIQHGLASLSAVLKSRGHTVNLIDLRECSDWNDVHEKMKLAKADFFGVYMPTIDFHEASKIADYAKTLGVPSVVGGPHPSICPDYVTENTVFDYVFAGEGEVTFPELIENRKTFSRIVRGTHPDLNSLPMEDRSIFNMKKILSTKHTFYPTPFVNVISGRGCPFQCGFCKPGEDMIFGKFRMRSVENLMKEIKFLADRYDYRMLMIDDDSFTLNPNYVAEFCDAYESINRPFTIQSRADFIVRHPELVKSLHDAGCWMMVIGLESFNQRLLDFMNKGTTVEENVEAVKICQSLGVKVWANIMYGLPTETGEEALETINWIRKLKPFHHSPSFYTPIIGTYLYEYSKKHGLLLNDDPAFLGCRSPTEPKIRGPDYKFLNSEIYKLNVERQGSASFERKLRKVAKWGLQKVGLC
jgi:anaerobic magnesium-protoporphyrin IX monomethyl ester cyclase